MTWTPGYPAVCSWHQRSNSSWVPADPERGSCAVLKGPGSKVARVMGTGVSMGGGGGTHAYGGTNLMLTAFIPSLSFWNKVEKVNQVESPRGTEGRRLRTEGQGTSGGSKGGQVWGLQGSTAAVSHLGCRAGSGC